MTVQMKMRGTQGDGRWMMVMLAPTMVVIVMVVSTVAFTGGEAVASADHEVVERLSGWDLDMVW